MMGSPLKRTFTAAVEDGYGLKYLKRRRMSGEMGFGPVVEQRVRREDGGSGNGNGVGALRARSVPEGMAVRIYALLRLRSLCWNVDILADERLCLARRSLNPQTSLYYTPRRSPTRPQIAAARRTTRLPR